MKINKNSLVLTAAFTGLLGGTMARLNAAPASDSSSSTVSSQAGQLSTTLERRQGKACLQGPEFLQGQGRLQGQRQRLQRQELLQGQGRLRHRRLQEVAWNNQVRAEPL